MGFQNAYHFLVIDDEQMIVDLLVEVLQTVVDSGEIFTATNGKDAERVFHEHEISIVFCDMVLPDISGVELLQRFTEERPEVQFVVVSGMEEIQYVRDALRVGALDYIFKPFTVDDVVVSVKRAVHKLEHVLEQKNEIHFLQSRIEQEKRNYFNRFMDTFSELIVALESKDTFGFLHFQNVARFSAILARRLGWDERKIKSLQIGCILHDIGKISVPDAILKKGDVLNQYEYAKVKEHVISGRNILAPSLGDRKDIMNVVLYHHERFDGSGYPDGLVGEEIPIEARIAGICEAYDAMRAGGTYRQPLNQQEIIEELLANKGKQFDPKLVDFMIDGLQTGWFA